MTHDSFTPHTEAFAKMFENGTEHDRSMLGNMHLHYESEVHRLVDEGQEPQNIAHSLNRLVDESVAATLLTKNGRKVQCKRGCAACCKINVSITREEAVLLVIAAAQKDVAIDWEKVERQSGHRLATWKDQTPVDRRCVFLNNHEECSVYGHRPAACRKYLVVSDPKNCDTIKFPGRDVTVLSPILGEAVASAMLGVLEWGSMPRMLLQAKKDIAP
jgi:Fe-S-cluster containining protein